MAQEIILLASDFVPGLSKIAFEHETCVRFLAKKRNFEPVQVSNKQPLDVFPAKSGLTENESVMPVEGLACFFNQKTDHLVYF
ncbi:hypothetical protein DXV75_05785 [Alteromonas aestuariivivens]|uniref:Uncharacterized protein n=1 Tax=Alteromonas aestuariivivens TaxID=1938339 RepID=A0A3D8MBX7_9ALTE|nr:hypothetical protein DXV75_05785 [Alteromonas aestuariivivens]